MRRTLQNERRRRIAREIKDFESKFGAETYPSNGTTVADQNLGWETEVVHESDRARPLASLPLVAPEYSVEEVVGYNS